MVVRGRPVDILPRMSVCYRFLRNIFVMLAFLLRHRLLTALFHALLLALTAWSGALWKITQYDDKWRNQGFICHCTHLISSHLFSVLYSFYCCIHFLLTLHFSNLVWKRFNTIGSSLLYHIVFCFQ